MTVTYTVAQLTDDTIMHLQGTTREQVNLLAVALLEQSVNYVDSVQLTYALEGAVPGAYLSIDDEAMLILETNPTTQVCTVLRGQHDSLLAAHAQNALVQVDPPWPRWVVMQALRDELRSWGPQVFQVKTLSITTQSQVRGYDLGDITPFFRILDVRMTPPPDIGTPDYVVYAGMVESDESWPRIGFACLNGNAPTTDFPSGSALIVNTRDLVIPGALWVTYAAPFDVDDSWTDSTDCLANIGLDSSDLDIPPYGAAWRLLGFREVRRMMTNVQGEPRDAQEVPALAILQAANEFKTMRDSRLGDAAYRLAQRYPILMSVF